MSGPTAAQEQLSQEQANFYQAATQQAQQTFAEDQNLQKEFADVYSPILAKGPNQQGFSAAEEENLNAQAVEGTAENYQQAARAVNEKIASEGGGTNPLPTGAGEELQAEVAESAAKEESQEESNVTAANYATGQQNFAEATGALESQEGNLNPAAYENAATGAGNAAETTQNQMADESDAWLNATLGAVGAVGGGWALGGFKTPCWIAAELYGGWNEPRTQLVRAWIAGPMRTHWFGRVMYRAYGRHGEQLAALIRRGRLPRWPFQILFDFALRRAKR